MAQKLPEEKLVAAAAAYLEAGCVIQDAAKAVGVSRTQFRRYMGESYFVAAVAYLQAEALRDIGAALCSAGKRAVRVLVQVMDTPEPPPGAGVRVRAALGIIDAALKVKNLVDIETRLIALEEKQNANRHHEQTWPS